MPRVLEGDRVPAFDAVATGGRAIGSEDLLGKPVILYFYPKDDTPGCTVEGKDFRDRHERFGRRNAVILGVSRDDLGSHEAFKAKFDFPFELVSDPDETLCELFDVLREDPRYGRNIERSTFLIDSEGVLRREWRKVRVEGHAEEVLDAVEAL